MSLSDEEVDRGCYQCGSTAFHDEDGLEYCSNGHLQSFSQRVVRDEDDINELGVRRSRALREKVAKRKVAKVLVGREAYELYLQAYQYVLWNQCHDLIEKHNVPADIWTVVRDLWTLRLSKIVASLDEHRKIGAESSDILSEDAGITGKENDAQTSAQGKKIRSTATPKLIESVSLCYLALIILRLPVGVGDLFGLIEKEDLTYLRAIRKVPFDMRNRMPGQYQLALDTTVKPKIDHMQRTVAQLASIYVDELDVSFPPLNMNIFLFQYIRRLFLPIDVYPATKALAGLVGYDFTLSSNEKGRRQVISHPEAQLISILIICVKLLFPFDSDTSRSHSNVITEPAAQRINWSVWLSEYRDLEKAESASGSLLGEGQGGDRLPRARGKEVEISDQDVFGMTDSQLDQYMDWYQRTWAKPEIEDQDNPSKEILSMFRIPNLPIEAVSDEQRAAENAHHEEAISHRIRTTVANLETGRLIADAESGLAADLVRPGQAYRLCRWDMEDLDPSGSNSQVNDFERAFFEAAAKTSGMSLRNLLLAVKQTERRISRWLDGKRRDEYWRAVDIGAHEDAQKGNVTDGEEMAEDNATEDDEQILEIETNQSDGA